MADPQSDSPAQNQRPLIVFVMGVSGCGKSTTANYIARTIGAHEKDADDLHPASNIDKMASGRALTDADRTPWLEQVAHYAEKASKKHGVCVMACSALKHQYRQILNSAGNVVYIFLHGEQALISRRVHERSGHFMPETLLSSQFATLEDPRDEPGVFPVSIDAEPQTIADEAISLLRQNHYL